MKLRQLKEIHHMCYDYCSSCATRVRLDGAWADLDGEINTYYCEDCVDEIEIKANNKKAKGTK